MQIKSYEGAVKYLDSFIGKVVFNVNPKSAKLHPPLDRMQILLSLLDNPQDKFKSVLVGGTSGKGSTAYLISHILTTAGYKTGLTISPHLQKINERLQINGRQISNSEFTKMVTSMIRIIEAMKKMPIGEPSYFEILIAMAFLYFAQQKVDIAVVEVGMGGEYDATNTLYPLVAVLTNVSLDHTNILGGTVQKIARTKIGIVKYGRLPHVASDARLASSKSVSQTRSLSERRLSTDRKSSFSSLASGQAPIVITGVKQPSVVKIVEDRCREVGGKLYRLGKDFGLTKLEVSLLGEYQRENASLAIETVLKLEEFGFKISDEGIKKALKTAFLPGRFEVVYAVRQPRVSDDARPDFSQKQQTSRSLSERRLPTSRQSSFSSSESGLSRSNYTLYAKRYTLVLDGAHNPTKMKAFLTSVKELYPKHKKIFIVGFKFDKDIPKMLQQITKVADKIIVTEFDRATDMNVYASANAESIKYQVLSSKYKGELVVEKDSKKALDLAFNYSITQLSNYQIIIVITGSLYLVGEIRNML